MELPSFSPAVKWIYATDTGHQRPTLCVIVENEMLCVQAGEGVRVLVRDAKEFMRARNVYNATGDAAPYPVSKAVAQLRRVAQRIGSTEAADILLDAIEANNVALLDGVSFTDEERMTMRKDDTDVTDADESEEAAPTVVKTKRRLPPPRKTTSAVTKNETVETTASPKKGTKEIVMASKKTAKKTPAKKTAVKAKAAPAKKAPPGEGGFRAGSNMEKGFVAYKAARKEYQAYERGDKQAWAQKLADKLDTTLNSVRTMISKNWEPLLAK